ncbi:MAG: dihydroorotase [Candidatus Saccharibacteria bacterium]|nr:dihydroorotase [Candidatus Saccharibacteria bacterium]
MAISAIIGGLVVNDKYMEPQRLDLIISDGKIIDIILPGKYSSVLMSRFGENNSAQIIDATGCYVMPGLIDTHVHFRDPGQTRKEDILTGAMAAKNGGFTSVVMMANTTPPIDTPETLRYCLKKGRLTGINIYACGSVTKGMRGEELTDMDALHEAGAIGFTDDGKPLMNEDLARKAMENAHRLGVPISFHEEDPAYVKTPGFNRGFASKCFNIGGADRMAEISLVERDVRLALETGARVVIQHVSAAESIEFIREGKRLGADIHAEATPHHFSLTEEDTVRYGALAKMNPPLRTESDRQAIIAGLRDGTIDLIATDHAPHTIEEKDLGLLKAPSGVIGLETALALGITNLVYPGHLTIQQLYERMSLNPATVYGLQDAGRVYQGSPADLVIFNPDEPWTVCDFVSKSSNSPFIGETLYGKIKYVFSGGRLVCSDDREAFFESLRKR